MTAGVHGQMAAAHRLTFRRVGLLSLTAISLLGTQGVQAANKTWDAGGGNLLWDTGNNWNVNGTPANGDTIIFANTFTTGIAINLNGNRTINDLSITGTTDFSLNNNTLTITTGDISRTQTSGTTTINSAIALGAAGAWSINGNLIANGIISGGSSSLTKSGTGTLTLANTNSYTGLTTVSGGTLAYGAANALSTGGITVSGGILDISTFSDSVGVVTLSSGSIDGTSGVLTGTSYAMQSGSASAILGGAGITLNKTTAGTVSLSGVNTYGGTTTISAGALQANDGTGLPTGSFLSLDGGVLQSEGVASFTRSLGTSGSSKFQWNTNGGGFSANGGKLTVTIANNAATELVWGTTVGSQIVGTLDFGSTTADAETELQNKIDLGNGTRTVDVASGTGGDFATLSGIIRNSSGTGNLTKNGTGKLVLSGNNSYNGVTTVSAGTLRATTSANSLGLGTLTLSGGMLQLASDTGLAFNRNTTVSASSTIESDVVSPAGLGVTHTLGTLAIGTQTLTIGKGSNVGSGSAGIAFGAVTLSGNASFSVASGAELTMGGVTSGSSDRTITFTGAGNTLVSGIIDDATGGAGAGNTTSVTKSGGGTLTLGTANTYRDITTISGGVVKVQNNSSLGTTTAGATVASGAAIQIDGSGLNVAEAITSLNGDGGGTGALHNLGNSNTWSGAITLADVTAVHRINSDSGLLTIGAGGITETGNSNNKDLTFGGAGDVAVTGNIIGSNGDIRLFKDGAGTLTLSGSANAFDGLTTISNGTLAYGVNNALVGDVTVNGGAFDIKTFSDTVGAVTLTSGSINGTTGVLTGTSYALNGTVNTTVSAKLAGAVNLTKSGAGTATLSGANTYSGTTSVTAGKLVVDGSLAGTTVSVSGGASLGGAGTIGTTTAGSVTLAAGNSAGTRGSIDLVNGSIGTLTLAARTATGTVLTMGGAAGNTSILNFEVGATADKIVLGTNARASIGAGGFQVNLTGLGSLDGVTRKLIDAPSGLASGSFATNTLVGTSGNFSGYTLALTSTATDLSLTQTANAAASAAYWKGTNNGVWNSFTGGNANTSNFASNIGGTNATGKVGATTDVNFNATSTANSSNTTLGEDFTIKTLTFSSAATSAVGIGGGNTLTITPGSSTTGVTVATGSGNHTISSKVALGANQTWTVVDAAQTLTDSNEISGAFALTKAGAGKLTLSGINTYTGDTTIKAGTLELSSTASLASTKIIVGDTGSSGAILDATASGLTVASGKTVSGIGTIKGSTTIQGILAPGNSAGVLNNIGNVNLQSGSTFQMEINGTAVGTGYDQLNVTGSATLGGALAVSMGFVPINGSLFFVLANDLSDSINGTFSNAPTNGGTYTLGGQQFQISYFGNYEAAIPTFTGGNDVVLMAVPEPAASLLGGVGVLLLLRRRRA